jgi:hypothetical protein
VTDGLRFRVFLNGKMALEEWVEDPELAQAASERHAAMALGSGKPWLVEIFDPDAPTDTAYIRFGSDPGGMVAPKVISPPLDLMSALGLDDGSTRG